MPFIRLRNWPISPVPCWKSTVTAPHTPRAKIEEDREGEVGDGVKGSGREKGLHARKAKSR
jgi:hypothetical protein